MIRKLATAFAFIGTLAWTVIPVEAGWMMNPHRFGVALVNGYVAGSCQSNTADQSVYTFTNVNIGPYSSTRGIIIAEHAEDAATVFHHTSTTVGGVTATELIDIDGGVLNNAIVAVPHATQPTTSTDTVVVTMSEAITGLAICVFTIYDNCNGGTADYQLLNSDSLFDTDSGAMDISNPSFTSGYGLLLTTADNTAGTTTYTASGGSEVYDNAAGTEFQYSAYFTTASPGWSATVGGTGDAMQGYFTCGS